MSAEHLATVTPLTHRSEPVHDVPAIPAPPAGPSRATQVASLVTPPDIWSDDRPALRKLWLYARHGRWTRGDGALRFAGTCYSLFAMAAHALLYTLGWIIERPARFLTAATVAALIKLAF